METTTCETCKHMQEMPNGYECRAHPPRIIDAFVAKVLTDEDYPIVHAMQGGTSWPYIELDDYCGEWATEAH